MVIMFLATILKEALGIMFYVLFFIFIISVPVEMTIWGEVLFNIEMQCKVVVKSV